MMNSLECVAAFNPVSEKPAPEILAELKQVHRCMREIKAENLALRSEVVQLSAEMKSMAAKIARLQSNFSLFQKQNVRLVKELKRKLDRLLHADGSTSKSMDTVNQRAVVSSPVTAKKEPPAKRQRLSPAETTA